MFKQNPVSIRNSASVSLAGIEKKSEFFSFHNLEDKKEHIAVGLGDWQTCQTPLVRIHSECMTGDVFGSSKCDCGNQLQEAIEEISKEGGFILYLRQEGRGIGLYNKIDAYCLQNQGMDTFEANKNLGFPDDMRSFKVAAEMILALGHNKVKLMSNNPIKRKQLTENGVQVVEAIKTSVFCNPYNYDYLQAKINTTQHDITLPIAI